MSIDQKVVEAKIKANIEGYEKYLKDEISKSRGILNNIKNIKKFRTSNIEKLKDENENNLQKAESDIQIIKNAKGFISGHYYTEDLKNILIKTFPNDTAFLEQKSVETKPTMFKAIMNFFSSLFAKGSSSDDSHILSDAKLPEAGSGSLRDEGESADPVGVSLGTSKESDVDNDHDSRSQGSPSQGGGGN